MTRDEIARLQEAVGVTLPGDLRQLYEQYPFASGSWAADFAMPDDPELLVQWNTPDSGAKTFGLDPAASLQIGGDGGESLYYALFDGPRTAIVEADLETGATSRVAEDLSRWVAQLVAMDEELRNDERAMGRRRWWQLWRRESGEGRARERGSRE